MRTITMINKIDGDIDIRDIVVSEVVKYLFRGYSIIPNTYCVWGD